MNYITYVPTNKGETMTRITIIKLFMIWCCITNVSNCAKFIEAGNSFGAAVTLTLFLVCLTIVFYNPRR